MTQALITIGRTNAMTGLYRNWFTITQMMAQRIWGTKPGTAREMIQATHNKGIRDAIHKHEERLWKLRMAAKGKTLSNYANIKTELKMESYLAGYHRFKGRTEITRMRVGTLVLGNRFPKRWNIEENETMTCILCGNRGNRFHVITKCDGTKDEREAFRKETTKDEDQEIPLEVQATRMNRKGTTMIALGKMLHDIKEKTEKIREIRSQYRLEN